MGHTPGPWQAAHRKREDGMWSTEVFTADGEAICSVAWYPRPIDEHGVIGTYREANARLIAAAPELLAALKELFAVADAPDDATDAQLRRFGAALDSATAAITKAEQP